MKNILTQNLGKYFLPEGKLQTTFHSFNKGIESVNMLNASRNAIKLVAHFFSPIDVLADKPLITVTPNTVIVHIFYYIPTTGQTLNNNTINNLGEVLSSLFGRSVELRLVKLHYPYLNSYVLAQYIALNSQDYTLVQIVRRIFGSISPVKNLISDKSRPDAITISKEDLSWRSRSFGAIVGIKVRVAGRLMTERSRPRQTVQTAQIGSFAKNNLSLVDNASFTSKNKKGAFTVKVWISQQATVSAKK